MTIANTFAAKASVAFVAVAMALSMISPAQAQTAEELQAQIDTLMATIAALQAQAGMTAQTPSGNAYMFTRSLTIGSQGADVTALQNYLIGANISIPAGATGYFGTQTQAAVASWQSANGVMPAVGYFGPVSQAKYAALLAVVGNPSDDDSSDDDSSDDDSDSTELQGQASLGDTDLKDGDDTNIEEGQEAAPVAELELEFDNGDARISRIDLSFVDTGSEEDPWDTFEEVSLWVDGDEVASMAVDDEDDWLDEDDGTLRFSGLDIVAMEDEAVTIVIGVTVQGSVDDLPATWNVDALNVRYVDADDVTSTDTIAETAVDFEIEEAGSDDELIIKTSSEDPDATTLQVEDDSKSDMMTIFAFDLDSDDSTNDLELNNIRVGLQSATADVGNIINDAVLVIDGEEFDDWSYADSAGTDVTINFDIDGEYTIDAGDRVTAELQVEFKKLDGVNYSAGETITGTTTATGYDVEGADDVTPTGSATGETHTLRVSGANLEAGTMTETRDAKTDGTTADDEGVFVLKFDVTAFEADLYIVKSAASSTASATGVSFLMTNGSGDEAGTTTPTASLTSTAASETGTDSVSRFVVNEGETETFTLTVNYNPGNVGAFYAVQLYSLNYKTANTGAATVVQQRALPVEDFETDPLAI